MLIFDLFFYIVFIAYRNKKDPESYVIDETRRFAMGLLY